MSLISTSSFRWRATYQSTFSISSKQFCLFRLRWTKYFVQLVRKELVSEESPDLSSCLAYELDEANVRVGLAQIGLVCITLCLNTLK